MSYSHVEALREYPDGVEVPLETRQEGSGHRLAAVVPLPERTPCGRLPVAAEEQNALQHNMMRLNIVIMSIVEFCSTG